MENPVTQDSRVVADYDRFVALLSPGTCSPLPYDEILFETSGCVITPTLGSILPYWLLVIPRVPSVNFVQWRTETRIEPYRLVGDILAQCRIESSRAIWFEHGPAERGSSVGCGVDHAHLHVIINAPFSFDAFIAAAAGAGGANWRERPIQKAYGSIFGATSYLLAASADRSVMVEGIDHIGSQFFRRVIAGLVDQPDAWNYRTHPHIENVRKTLEAFGSEAARRVSQ